MNKRVLLLIISIIVVIFILTTTTYAFFYNTDRLANSEDYTTGLLDIEVDTTSSGLGNTLTLNNAVPMSDSDGMNTTPYRFKLTNVGNLDYKFDLNFTKSGTINGNYVKLAVDDNTPITLPNTTTTILDDFVLYAGESKTISIRVWLDENTPNSEMTKTFSGTLGASGVGNVLPVPLVDKIIALSQGDTYAEDEGNGVYATNSYNDNGKTKYHEYRYVGGEVDNWVRFNNDDYRIIGVFDDNSHGVEGEWLVKLISANELTAVAWGAYNTTASSGTYSNYKNDWTGTTTGVKASPNVLLNEYFLNGSNTSTTYGECINWTYGYNSNTYKSKNCSNIKGYGIQTENLRNYIQPVTWYLYGYTGVDLSKQNWYNCERNNYSGCTSANSGTYSGTTTASIGLMYVSDYMCASGYIASSDTSTTGSSSNFMNSNWLYNGFEWTITPMGNSDYRAFSVNSAGYVVGSYSSGGGGLRPTFYLKSIIKIKSGSGSFNDPYIIG